MEKDETGAIIKNDPYAGFNLLEGRAREEAPIPLEMKKAVVVAKTTR